MNCITDNPALLHAFRLKRDAELRAEGDPDILKLDEEVSKLPEEIRETVRDQVFKVGLARQTGQLNKVSIEDFVMKSLGPALDSEKKELLENCLREVKEEKLEK